MKSEKVKEEFYKKVLDILIKNKLPFMVGGTYALRAYLGIDRPTKDIDIRTPVDDYPKVLKTFSDLGYKTVIHEQTWIAKVFDEKQKELYFDVIYAEKNGLRKIERSWIELARPGTVLGYNVKLEPIEDLICSKIYIQHKERFDGSDVHNLILKYGKELNWDIILEKLYAHWELLLAHVINYLFVYPSERQQIPKKVIDKLLTLLQEQLSHPPPDEKVTRGLLISSQYEVAVAKWGYKPIQN